MTFAPVMEMVRGENTMSELAGCRVLVLDDEILIALMVSDHVEELGCELVGPVSTVADALELVTGGTIQVALIDVKVGAEASFPVADTLIQRGIPFAFMTAYPESDIGRLYPGVTVITKPFHIGYLRGVLIDLVSSA